MGIQNSTPDPLHEPESGRFTPAFLVQAESLLRAGQLHDLTALLGQQQHAAAAKGDTAAANLLLAIQQLCFSLVETQAEIDHHREALVTVTDRADAVQANIVQALQLFGDETEPMGRETAVSLPSLSSPTLWQRLQTFLGLGSPDTTTDSDASVAEETAVAPTKLPPSTAVENPSPTPAALPTPDPPPSHALAIYCFGPFRVYQQDELINEWNSLKALAILKFIIAKRCKPITKELLMDAIWPDVDPEAARRNLHQAIYSLRKTLRRREPDFQHIQFRNNSYLLNSQIELWVDFLEFEKWAREGQHQEAAGNTDQAYNAYGMAESLYEGDFLEDDPYTEWASAQRDQLHNMYLNIAGRLIKFYIERRDYVAAIALGRKALAYEPSYETAHRRLMRCYLAQGQRHLAVRQYQICAQRLAEDLDLTPSPETTKLYQQITQP